jgi:alginate O-acetyltransferase complex protein AlgJ
MDTHWRPDAMQRVAEGLAAFVAEHAALAPTPSPGYSAQRREAQQLGDTAAMLDLPRDQSLYSPERVTLRFITDAAGEPWRSSRDADVLLLGDSFTNIYSLATMGWGEAAGFAEQLSFTLQRPIDRIVQNDQGAHATRALLRHEVSGATDRLAGKRVVVWQFAVRELAQGDWKVIEIPPAR